MTSFLAQDSAISQLDRRWRIRTLRCLISLSILTAAPLRAEQDPFTGEVASQTPERIKSLNFAGKHFQQEVAFSCTFAFETGSSKDWGSAWQQANVELKSQTHKMSKVDSDFTLFMGEYQLGGQNGPHSGVSMLSTEGIQMVINSPPGGYKLIPPDTKHSDRFLSYWNDPINFSPFFLGGGKLGELVPPLMPELPDGLVAVDNVSVDDSGRLIVEQQITAHTTKGAIKNRLEFEILDGVPTLALQVYEELRDDDGSVRMQSRCEFSGFVKCGDVHMASSIASALGPVGPEHYLYWRWQSADLGNRQPTDGDFVLEVPDNIKLQRQHNLPEDRRVDRTVLRNLYATASNQ
ncbi:MAG: hypothetical protein O3C40_25320, partial [Planctomycetota bacterium]|nr:hypothetical protein [Planctomycetota bacterium]